MTSNLAEGAAISKSVNVGGMSIAGNKFAFTGDGIVAQGKATPIPGLPDAPAAALKALGISFELGKVDLHQVRRGRLGHRRGAADHHRHRRRCVPSCRRCRSAT